MVSYPLTHTFVYRSAKQEYTASNGF